MDGFGVLVESIGFRAQGKSAPMAKLKPKPKCHSTHHSNVNTSLFDDSCSLPVDKLDEIFQSSVNIGITPQTQNTFLDDDIFGVSSSQKYGCIDLESALSGSNAGVYNSSYLGARKSAGSDAYDDFFGSKSKQVDPVDDLLGGFGLNSSLKQEKKEELEELIPGFGGARPSKTNSRVESEVDRKRTGANDLSTGTSSKGFEKANYVDEIFGGGVVQQNNATRASSMAQNSIFEDFFHEEKKPEVKKTHSQSKFSTKKASSATDSGNDFTSLFGDVTTSSGEFHEIEGESEERRRARLKRYLRTNERMAEALVEKNRRDLQIQYEQEEKRRLAETLDNDIKRWAAGREGNLRALLSSLQQILGPESGWCPFTLTDMITSNSVKKVYMKATLFVHPDKVQQRGANLQQKYIAEKVFDILKEAWNKFNAEELQ